MDLENDLRFRVLLVVALGAIIIGGIVDLILDQPDDWLSVHVMFETLMIAGALLMTTTLWLGWWRSSHSVSKLRRSLEAREEERDAWRDSARRALHGLSQAIDAQFDTWDLTPSEAEVALLLLKGYSHKAIAKHTGRSAQTVRQHAAAVYRKGDLSGRAELSAFFLDNLMLPADRRELG